MNKTLRMRLPLVALVVVSLTGCLGEDERLVELARESSQRQASQNREMAQLNQQVAQSHKELLSLQRSLESQQAEVNTQRDQMESERRDIARQRLRESLLAPILESLGPLVVCALVLVFCASLVYGLRGETGTEEKISEVLIEELTSNEPRLLLPQAESLTANEPPRQLSHQRGSEPVEEQD